MPNAESIERRKTSFQKNKLKMQTYVNPFKQNNDPRRRIGRHDFVAPC